MVDTYVIRLKDQDIVLQSGSRFDTSILSSGTKVGVEVEQVVATLIQGHDTFYYCDKKFSHIHTPT